MSRLAFRSPDPTPQQVEAPQPIKTHHIVIEATVAPLKSRIYDKDKVEKQAEALSTLRSSGKDIFTLNETRKVQSAGTILYQTTETYGTPISVEKIIEKLQQHNLTLRVNFHRPGVHSNTTCMNLSADTLTRLLHTEEDAHNNKIAELRVKAEEQETVPAHGSMYVAVSKKGTQHYLSHVDYKIMASYDAMYHENV